MTYRKLARPLGRALNGWLGFWLLIIVLTVSFPGCGTTQVRYLTEPLPLPVRPVLPALSADDVACLSDDAYRRLVERDTGRRHYAEELEAIIRATHTDETEPTARHPPEPSDG